MTCGVRNGRDATLGLDEDLRAIATDDGEEGIVVGLLETHLKPKRVTVEGDSSIDIADDE